MNILVTGSNGQLGSEIRLITKKSEHNYLFTDISELDITDSQAVREYISRNNIAIVVNCAAYTNVDKAEDDYSAADRINHTAAENLAVVCKERNATLIHISTDYVFNGNNNIPYSENEATDPTGIYGKTKLAGETAILKTGCKSLIIRTSWLYSSFGNNFVKTMQRLTSEKDSLNVVFDQTGTPTYAADLAELIVHIIRNGSYETNNGIFHYSNEGVCSWYDFAIEIASQFDNKCDIKPCHSSEFPSKVKRPHYSVLDKTKIKKSFDITIPYWKDSLTKCINLLRS